MSLDYTTLETLRQNHPAWRLLASPHAALMASFFQQVFVDKNARVIAQADLVEALEDELFHLREQLGDDKFPKSAPAYVNDSAAPEKGWLRKFYREDSDELQFDRTPATEKILTWLDNLKKRSFVGTESRLLTLFECCASSAKYAVSDTQALSESSAIHQPEQSTDSQSVVNFSQPPAAH